MKKLVIYVLLSFVCHTAVYSQKIGYCDMEYIVSKMPEYQKAKEEMNSFSEKWAKEIKDKFAEVDRKQREFMAEEILLTEDIKKRKQEEINRIEKEARDYNNRIFGMDGVLFEKKKELMKPIMEKIQRAADKVSIQKRVDFMFDKSGGVSMIYTNPRHDYTDYIMEELGLEIKPDTKQATASSTSATTPSTNKTNSTTKKPK
jgi:outer membrane protein